MKLRTSRRTFLGTTGAGLAGAALTASRAASAPDAAERQRLIELAHFGRKAPAEGAGGMAITSHPLATRAAVDILKRGGNACDAALAASITQTVVEPHMTTITGCLSQMYFDQATGETTYVNGNVNAPMAPLPGYGRHDLAGGRGVAVPGWWGGFEAAHDRHGSLSRKDLMADAIAYARDGFEMHPFLWGEVFIQSDKIGKTAAGREIFFDGNAIPRPGATLYQKEAADTLERLAEEGNDYFYRGDFANEVCEVVQAHGGVLTREDFERWEPRWQEPAWGSYRDLRIAGSPPPDNGGTHIIEMLHMLEFLDLEGLGPPTESAESLLQMVRISHLVYTEGGRQNDPESHPLPLETILSKDYAKMRFDLLQMGHPVADASEPPPPAGSNHVTVVDAAGNVSTILHSCMSYPWSNGLFAGGVSVCAAGAHFFRVMPKPGHRISAYVAPNVIFRGNRPVMASGSPSVSLLQNVLQNSLNVLQFGVPVGDSVNRPRFGGPSLTVPGAVLIEADFPEKIREKVAARGINFDVVNPWNWHHGSFEGIHIGEDGVRRACGDPRRCSMAEATA
ncbi:MAG: gamma-glutamyltransferase [Acidobacteria bacterium]|nr:gamma-glutamyltransferase [Acidobacteriota bacterium]